MACAAILMELFNISASASIFHAIRHVSWSPSFLYLYNINVRDTSISISCRNTWLTITLLQRKKTRLMYCIIGLTSSNFLEVTLGAATFFIPPFLPRVVSIPFNIFFHTTGRKIMRSTLQNRLISPSIPRMRDAAIRLVSRAERLQLPRCMPTAVA